MFLIKLKLCRQVQFIDTQDYITKYSELQIEYLHSFYYVPIVYLFVVCICQPPPLLFIHLFFDYHISLCDKICTTFVLWTNVLLYGAKTHIGKNMSNI